MERRWVESGIVIPNLEENADKVGGIVIDMDYRTAVAPIILPTDKPVSDLTVKDVCIECGLVLEEGQKSVRFIMAGRDGEHIMSCVPVGNLPGVFYASDICTEDGRFVSGDGQHSFVSVDARSVARLIEVPQKELVTVQKTLVDKDGNILDVKSVSPEKEMHKSFLRGKPFKGRDADFSL